MIKISSGAPDIIRYKVKASNLGVLEGFLLEKAANENKVLGKDFGMVINNPLFDEYHNFLNAPESKADWARENLRRNGYKISEVNDVDLTVYVMNSKTAVKKYVQTFISGIKSLFYSQVDFMSSHKKAKNMTKAFMRKYQKSSVDEYDINRELYYSMNKMYEKVGTRFDKYLKKFKIENFEVRVKN
jgi:hypothetical protein